MCLYVDKEMVDNKATARIYGWYCNGGEGKAVGPKLFKHWSLIAGKYHVETRPLNMHESFACKRMMVKKGWLERQTQKEL